MGEGDIWANERWAIQRPTPTLTRGHLVVVDSDPTRAFDVDAVEQLLAAYRHARSILWSVLGARGFNLSFPLRWHPDQDSIGEPSPRDDGRQVFHVFSRASSDDVSPIRVLAQPARERQPMVTDDLLEAALREASGSHSEVRPPAPQPSAGCDGCETPATLQQEIWRADGIRVLRPRGQVTEAQALVLPVRHVVSAGDLTADELVSMASRLSELHTYFASRCGSSGLSCFTNDGAAARQETPHVHLHVFGRARDEPANPFQLLGRRLGTGVHPTRPSLSRPTWAGGRGGSRTRCCR